MQHIKNQIRTILQKVIRITQSRTFLISILVLLALQALWIAVTARYPQAFDEHFHYGIIKLRAEQLSPFFASQPPDSGSLGPIVRDPSFLYHYLMSFPQRIIGSIFQAEASQVIFLRILNIPIMIAGLLLFVRALKEYRISDHIIHVCLLFFVLLPIVPQLAGQINYDNLIILITAGVFLYLGRFLRSDGNNQLDMSSLIKIVLLCMVGGLVKFSFLPVALGVGLFALVVLIRRRRTVWFDVVSLWQKSRMLKRILTLLAVSVLGWLMIGSYGLNLVRYQDPIPSCDSVLTVNECLQYGPWRRDYYYGLNQPQVGLAELPHYVQQWFKQMHYETFFMIYGYYDENGVLQYGEAKPLPIIKWSSVFLLILLAVALFASAKFWWSNRLYRSVVIITLLYGIVLFAQNFKMYQATGVPVAIHGRYLLPLVIPFVAVIAASSIEALKVVSGSQWNRLNLTLCAAFLVYCLLWTQGGGITSFWLRTNDEWFWQQSSLSQDINQTARSIVAPFILE